jgi:hypothetical protein
MKMSETIEESFVRLKRLEAAFTPGCMVEDFLDNKDTLADMTIGT